VKEGLPLLLPAPVEEFDSFFRTPQHPRGLGLQLGFAYEADGVTVFDETDVIAA
jgi:hypothetical protein